MRNFAPFIIFVGVAVLVSSYSSYGEVAVRATHRIAKRDVTAAHVLTDEQKTKILDKHNEMRGKVEPKAANMLKMKWNDTLAEIATNFSRNCVYDHNYGPGMEKYGENLYISTSNVDDKFAIDGLVMWFNEREDYNFETGACSKVCGHYTALVWAQTDMVGCGITTCDTVEADGDQVKGASLLVCNYYPAGNIHGESIYKEGNWCTECPDEYRCDNKLCSSSTRAAPTWTLLVILFSLSWLWVINT